MECPYCKSEDFVPCVAINNVDCYGDKIFNVCCKQCGGALKISLSRIVKLNSVRSTLFDEDDWGQKPQDNSVEILNNCDDCVVESCDMRGEAVECSGHVSDSGKLRASA